MPPSREGSERVINASVPSHPCVQNWIDEPPPAQHAQWLSLVLLRYGTSGPRDVVHRAPRRRVRSRRQRGSAPVPTAPTRPGQRLRAAASQLHQSLLSLVVTADGRDPPRTGTTIAPRRCTRQGRHRLVVPGDFEAVLRPAPGGLPRWTWQLTSATYQNDAQRIRTVIRQPAGTDPINHLLRQIHGYPAFRGIRSQIAALRALALAEWRRTKPENVRLELPPFPPYLRYKHHPIVEIQIVLERLLRSEPPITWEERIRPLGPMLVPLKDHRAACVTAEGRDDGR